MKVIDSFKGEYRWLSNFHLCEIEYEGIVYPSSEHAYQAAKTLDQEERLMMAKVKTPGLAKFMGRKIKKRSDWDDVKVQVMREILEFKFSVYLDLRDKLQATKGYDLIEGNTWGDTFWGVCKGKGRNWLGHVLMEIRDGRDLELGQF